MTTQRCDCCGKRCRSCSSNLTAADALDTMRDAVAALQRFTRADLADALSDHDAAVVIAASEVLADALDDTFSEPLG